MIRRYASVCLPLTWACTTATLATVAMDTGMDMAVVTTGMAAFGEDRCHTTATIGMMATMVNDITTTGVTGESMKGGTIVGIIATIATEMATVVTATMVTAIAMTAAEIKDIIEKRAH